MTPVECNECGQDFELPQLKKKILKDAVYEFYFRCPHCKHKYTSYYTNPKIRRDIKRLSKKRELSKTTEESRGMLAQIKMNDKLIEKDMDGLKDRITKTLT